MERTAMSAWNQNENEDETKSSLSRNILHLSRETKELHKELLLGLFLHCSEQELAYLAQKSGTSTLKEILSQGKSHAVNKQAYTPGSLSLVPEVVQQIVENKQDEEKGSQSKKHLLTALDWKARDDYHAFSSVKELEKHVSQKFDSYVSQKQTFANGDDNISNKATASPVSILYNECSFGAFSRWAAAANDSANQFNDSQTTYYCPTSTPLFRKCFICHNYGHYEVECQEMTESSLLRTVEPHLRAQVMMKKLAPDRTTSSSYFPSSAFHVANLTPGEPFLSTGTAVATLEESIAPSSKRRRVLPNKNQPSGDDLQNPSHPPDCAIHDTEEKNCSVCHLSLHQKDMLSCNSCNKSFHYQCLKEIGDLSSRSGEWFCEACLSYESDVSSTVDIEPCDGFIIEQRKKSSPGRHDIGNTTFGFHDTGWTCALSVSAREHPNSTVATAIDNTTLPRIDDDNNSNDYNISDVPKHQHPHGSWDDAVVDELDGIKIFSKPLEDHHSETLSALPLFQCTTDVREQAETSDVLSDVSHPFEELSKHGVSPETLIGALVTWSISSKDLVNGRRNHSDTKRLDETDMFISSKHSTDKSNGCNSQSKGRQMIGSVVTLDHFNTFALIRLLPNSCEVITELGRILHNTSQSSSSSSSAICRTAIGACNLGASLWVPVKSLSLIQAVRDTSVKEKAQYNLINALKSEHLKRKNLSCTVPDDEPQQQECASTIIPSGESPDQGDESDVFQAERILDERINRDTSMKEYYVKWKGYDIKDSTWVPERNIITPNLVRIFAVDRLIHELEATPQANDCSSVTSNVIKALTEGRKRLVSLGGGGSTAQKLDKPVGRICPFCERWCVNGIGLSTHLKIHEGEPNYKAIREAFKLGFEYNYIVS